jgi:hypothetical protein
VSTLATLGDLDEELRPDTVYRLRGAKVAFADYSLLQRDFDELCDRALFVRFPELKRLESDAQRVAIHDVIDQWLVEHSAVVSEAQQAQALVNSEIRTAGPPLKAHRPPRYGRSVVVDLREIRTEGSAFAGGAGGLLDLKGVGVSAGRRPANKSYANGLEYLGVALGDYLIKRIIDAIFLRTVPGLSTVPVYAVLDLGFDIHDGWRGTAPAGLHVRKAHRRPRGGSGIPPSGSPAEAMSVFIELLLRAYGLTSVNQGNCLVIESGTNGRLRVTNSEQEISHALDPEDQDRIRAFQGNHGDLRIERINIQLTRDVDEARRLAQIFDFGHMNIRAEFHNPLASTVSDAWLCIGGVLWPDSPSFVRPDQEVAPPLGDWHRHALNDFCFGLAHQLREGVMTSAALRCALEKRLECLIGSWPGTAGVGGASS